MLRIFGEDFARDPWAVLRSLREEGGVHRVVTPDGPPAWLVTRFDDVRNGLADNRFSPQPRYADERDYRGFDVPPPLDMLQSSEPEVVAGLRSAMTAELHPRRLAEWDEGAAEIVSAYLETVDASGEFDLVERVVTPLPAAVLGRLFGLPEQVRTDLLDWARATLRPRAAPQARETLRRMGQIITAAIAYGRGREDDTMLVRLVRSEAIGPDAIVAVLFYLLFVWYEVLVDVICGAVLSLSTGGTEAAMVLSGPDRLVAVDELLRYLSPQIVAAPRFAVTDLEIGRHRITAGQSVLFCLASANHDDEKFTRPDELDLARTPNPHLALGHGFRTCLGTGLVRPVTATVLAQLYARWPRLRVLDDEQDIRWRSGFRHRGPLTLRVSAG
ncbi:cytochrome P450 [Nocardia sp. NPDC051570]|uniref:cytochrome P450 n=1 Tax=Nocardia sp. NPDC051570 TaxID=3364324 RepID=UPI0037BB9FF5